MFTGEKSTANIRLYERMGYVEDRRASAGAYDMVIPAGARQVGLAHRFINFVLDPHVAAELTELIYFLCPNEVSYQYLSAEFRTNPILFPPPEVVEKLEMIGDIGPSQVKYEKIWQEIQAGN